MPVGGTARTTTVNGRTYVCAAGATLDMPDFDAQVAQANGWVAMAGGVGATAARPSNPSLGMIFHDTTLNLNIVFEGKSWRNPATGGAV
jgi:hypothetical protein